MSSANKNLSIPELDQLTKLENAKIGIVTAEWNHDITFAMRDSCIGELKKYGCDDEDLFSISVPEHLSCHPAQNCFCPIIKSMRLSVLAV